MSVGYAGRGTAAPHRASAAKAGFQDDAPAVASEPPEADFRLDQAGFGSRPPRQQSAKPRAQTSHQRVVGVEAGRAWGGERERDSLCYFCTLSAAKQ